MKNLSASLLLVLLALAGQLSAQTIRRVNNNGITGANIYTTVQLAHDAAASGDIIQLEPSTTGYGNLTCTKQLTIVGTGYFLSENQPPALQANIIPATVGQVIFNPGSNGTSMSGLITGNVYFGASNLIFQRNYVSGATLYVNYNVTTTNNVVRQNYLYSLSYNTALATTNLLITNNIIQYDMNVSGAGFTGEFSNNVVLRYAYFDGFTAHNNYFGSTLTTTANTTWSYNLLAQATLPTLGSQSNNTANVPVASVFVLAPTGPGQFDAWYKLKAGSPAIGAGVGGIDIGAYGSATGFAYRIAGIPAIPTIYQLSQTVSGNTLNVNVSTRSNN
ncbi:MAG: hypothetical protein M3Y54_21110 [Bacteroidota bacterium]|nr:hypothetical protein [Bacteroidota bacterium]